MPKSIKFIVSNLKPRNVFATLAARRKAGAHARSVGGQRQQAEKDLVQRLREAGL